MIVFLEENVHFHSTRMLQGFRKYVWFEFLFAVEYSFFPLIFRSKEEFIESGHLSERHLALFPSLSLRLVLDAKYIISVHLDDPVIFMIEASILGFIQQ